MMSLEERLLEEHKRHIATLIRQLQSDVERLALEIKHKVDDKTMRDIIQDDIKPTINKLSSDIIRTNEKLESKISIASISKVASIAISVLTLIISVLFLLETLRS